MTSSTERMLFRLTTAGFVIGLSLCGWVVGYAQSGPRWEVPQTVTHGLTFMPAIALLLALAGLGAAVKTRFYPNLPSRARQAHFVVAVIVLLLPLLIWTTEPAQWVVTFPKLSFLAAFLPIPITIIAAMLYWLIAIRALKTSNP